LEVGFTYRKREALLGAAAVDAVEDQRRVVLRRVTGC
jgi:hypothetical protein